MPDQKIATERVFRTDAAGVERLVAAPGDPMPAEDTPVVGYREMIDLRADTADAALAKGEQPPTPKVKAEAYAETLAADEENYAPPLPKPGEEDSIAGKAKKAAAVEDKARKKA